MNKLSLFLLSLPLLFACSSAPKHSGPITDVLDISLVSTDVPMDVRNFFYTMVLKEIHSEKPFKANPHPSRRQETQSRWQAYGVTYRGGVNLDYYYVYNIDNNNRLIKTTLNRPWRGADRSPITDCVLCKDRGFTAYADQLAIVAAERYNQYIDDYYSSTSENISREQILNDLLETVKVDVTSSFPLSEVDKRVVTSSLKKDLALGKVIYVHYKGLKIVEPAIKFFLESPGDNRGRYKDYGRLKRVDAEISPRVLRVGDEPIVNIELKSGYYDLLPDMFAAQNSDIDIQLDNGYLIVMNKTRNYIDVESFTSYWGDRVSNLKQLDLSVPPQSSIRMKVSDRLEVYWRMVSQRNPRYVKLSDPQGVFNFGMALSYFVVDTSERNTLLERKAFRKSELFSNLRGY